MFRQKDRQSLIVCLASVLEMDQPIQAIAEDRKGGERWSFDCFRTVEQWKVSPDRGQGCVFGHNTGFKWKFYDTRSCTHIEVSRRDGVYTIWDFGGMNPVQVTFLKQRATLHEPATGARAQYQVVVG